MFLFDILYKIGIMFGKRCSHFTICSTNWADYGMNTIFLGCGTFAHQMEEDNCSPKREATVDHRDNRPRRQLTTATIDLDDFVEVYCHGGQMSLRSIVAVVTCRRGLLSRWSHSAFLFGEQMSLISIVFSGLGGQLTSSIWWANVPQPYARTTA